MSDALSSHYESLGRLAAAAARMEQVVDFFLRDAITPDPVVGALVIGGVPFDRRVELLKSVLSARVPDDKARARVFDRLGEAKALMKDRNAFLHGMWGPGPDDTLVVTNRSRSTDAYTVRPVADGKVREVAGQLMWVAQMLEWAHLSYGERLGTYESYGDSGLRRVGVRPDDDQA